MIAKAPRQQLDRVDSSAVALKESVIREDWTQVLSLCQRILPTVQNRADVYELMGNAFVHQGDDSAAIAAYQKGIRIELAQPKSHYALGMLYARQRRHMRAICHYQWALSFWPSWSKAAFNLGKLFHRVGACDKATATYRDLLRRDPNYADAYLALGQLYEYKGDFYRAAKQYRQALLAQANTQSASLSDPVLAYRSLGSVLVRLKQPKAATKAYREALLLQPKEASLHNQLGQSLFAQGDTPSAFAAYQQALALNPSSVGAHCNLGRLWYNHQNFDKAINHFQKAIRQAPQNAGVLSSCARTLTAQGRWRELFDCFKLAIAHQPDFVTEYCQRTVGLPDEDLLFQLQKVCGLFLMGLRHADIDMAYSILCERLAQIYLRLGDLSVACNAPAQATSFYQLALTLTPKAIQAYRRLADCLIGQGRLAAGITTAQAGLLALGQKTTVKTDSHLQLQTILQQGLEKYDNSALLSDGKKAQGVYRKTQDWLDNKAPIPVPTAETASWPNSHKCGGVTCQICMSVLISRFSPTQIGQRAFRCNPAPPLSDFSYSTFAVTIPNGRAWIAPKKNAWSVCHEIAIFTPDDRMLADLSRSYPWYLPGCQQHDATHHSIFRRVEPLPPAQRLRGKVAVLSGLSGHIYYHWLFDVLPRINVLCQYLRQQDLELSSIDYFVVNNFDKSYQIETLTALGIPEEKVISSDRLPHIEAEELVVPSFAGHFDWVPPASIDFLRHHLLRATDIPAHQQPKRIYISREKAKYRKILNQAAVVELLDQFGFVSIALETMTVDQQAQLFDQAEIVVAPHGSGLANLTFCSPGTTVVECFSPHYLRTDYWMISQYLQLNHYYLVGESFACDSLRQLMYPSELTEDFSVDITALRSLLTQLI